MQNEIVLLQKQMRALKLGLAGLAVLLALAIAYIFLKGNDFAEINVERINVREKDGTVKLVISNKQRQHPGRMNGKELAQRVREAGLIFFNGEGDECGGLVYDSDRETAGMVYSIDKFRDDQVMQLQYDEKKKTHQRKYGLQLWSYGKEDAFQERYDRFNALDTTDKARREAGLARMKKDGLLATERLFVGKTYQDDIGLFIKDAEGNIKIRLYVDSTGTARLEFLDNNGKEINNTGY